MLHSSSVPTHHASPPPQAVSIAGYMAFGNAVPSNILTGFVGPVWVVVWANVMVVIHMIAAYQVYAQPLLVFAEMNYDDWDRAPQWTKASGRGVRRKQWGVGDASLAVACLTLAAAPRGLGRQRLDGEFPAPAIGPFQPPNLPPRSHPQKWLLRLTLRPLFVVVICVLGICLPFFSDIVGLVGAIGVWGASC